MARPGRGAGQPPPPQNRTARPGPWSAWPEQTCRRSAFCFTRFTREGRRDSGQCACGERAVQGRAARRHGMGIGRDDYSQALPFLPLPAAGPKRSCRREGGRVRRPETEFAASGHCPPRIGFPTAALSAGFLALALASLALWLRASLAGKLPDVRRMLR